MNIYVEYTGEINVYVLNEKEKKLVGKEKFIQNFIKKVINRRRKVLIIDRSPDIDITALLLEEEIEKEKIKPNKRYRTSKGFTHIWLPWGFETPVSEFDEVMIINPPYMEGREGY